MYTHSDISSEYYTYFNKTGRSCKTAIAFWRFDIISGISPVKPRHSALKKFERKYVKKSDNYSFGYNNQQESKGRICTTLYPSFYHHVDFFSWQLHFLFSCFFILFTDLYFSLKVKYTLCPSIKPFISRFHIQSHWLHYL